MGPTFIFDGHASVKSRVKQSANDKKKLTELSSALSAIKNKYDDLEFEWMKQIWWQH